MTKVQGWIFATLHTLGSLALIILLSLLLGCLRDEPLKTDPMQEASATEILDALINNSPSPDSLQAGDNVWVGHYVRTFTNPFFAIGQDTYAIKSKEYFEEGSGEDFIAYNVLDITHVNAEPDGTVIQIREGKCQLILSPLVGWYPKCKIELPPFQDQFYELSDGGERGLNAFSPVSLLHTRSEAREFKFYNLKVTPDVILLPYEMAKAGKCFNFKDCRVPVKKVEFDIQSSPSTSDVSDRQHYKVTFAKDLPYLGSTLETCIGYQAIIDGKPALVDECFRVLDINLK